MTSGTFFRALSNDILQGTNTRALSTPPLSQNQGRMYFLPFLMGGVDNKMIYLSFPLRDPTYGGEQEHRGATQQHTSGD